MILTDFLTLATLGAERPLCFWTKEYAELATRITPGLLNMSAKLEKTATKKNLDSLCDLLKTQNPNEFVLAEHLNKLHDTLQGNTPDKHQTLIANFAQKQKEFFTRAQVAEVYRKHREDLKNTLTVEEQKKQDYELFAQIGMMYSLEYYLVLYKAMIDAPSVAERKKYIEAAEVTLGAHKIPGLWTDFMNDEVLIKFIYLILDDFIRNSLLTAYYATKLDFKKIDNYNNFVRYNIEMVEVLASLRGFIQKQFTAFQQVGIEKLTSFFFKPYGEKPFIKNINL